MAIFGTTRVVGDAERADVHVREVRDVHEVVGHPRRRRPPHLDAGVDAAVRGVVLGGDLGDPGDRIVEAQPHQPVALDDVDRAQVARGGIGTLSGAEGTRTQRPSAPNVQPW